MTKPRDLKPLFCFRKQSPIICNRIFHLPKNYTINEPFNFPLWEDPIVFGNNKPIAMEFCSGNGHWIIENAAKDPTKNWVAVEKRFDRIQRVWSKAQNKNLSNLFLVCGEGELFLRSFVARDSVEFVIINFPDPWPKRRHEKHRLMKPSFVLELSRILKKDGLITFVSDDFNYVSTTVSLFCKTETFIAKFPYPYYSTRNQSNILSTYEALWRSFGKTIYCTEFLKK